MDFKDFTVILDEYVVVDPEDGFCFFWSKSEFEANLFYKVNRSLHSSLLPEVFLPDYSPGQARGGSDDCILSTSDRKSVV